MFAQEALRETGKATQEDLYFNYVATDKDGVLHYYGIKDNSKGMPLSLTAIMKYDFKPYHPKEEIRPKEAGELWRHDDGNYAHTSKGEDCVWLYADNCPPIRLPAIFMNIIHNQNGWKRIHPHVPDDNMEEIVIEGVRWYEDGDGDLMPSGKILIPRIFQNKPPMTMTLRYKKESNEN